MNRNGIKKVGTLYGKPLVEGDPNLVRGSEILVNKEDKYITLATRDKGDMKSLSDFSSMEGRFYNIEVMYSSRNPENTRVIKTHYNPDTLEKMFSNLPYISYDSSTGGITCFIRYTFSSSKIFNYCTGSDYLGSTVWLDRQESKEKIKEFLNTLEPSQYTGYLYPINKLDGIRITMAFRNGHFKGIIFNDTAHFSYQEFLSSPIGSSSVIFTNDKGEETDDSFGIVGSKTNPSTLTIDGSYVTGRPLLLISPLVNGMFVLGTFKGSKDLVLMNCLELDMKHLREVLGIPESMVIPCKEGEYIKYPNMN